MIYLDYNATTPIDKEVAAAMLPYLEQEFGNPSSMHILGSRAKQAVSLARKQVGLLINAAVNEVIFTSGGTESNNMAIRGVASALRSKGNHIITSSIEHPAVLEVCAYLEKNGFDLSYISVDENGMIDVEELKGSIRKNTILITVMHANNEVGTIQPIREIGEIAKKHGILFHCDAAQSVGKIRTDVEELGVDLMSIAGHKLYAPKGVGALYIRNGVKLEKLLHGANHEQNLRPGTENVIHIAGLGKACELAKRDLEENAMHMAEMKDLLYDGIKAHIPEVKRNGDAYRSLPNTLSLSFPGIEANTLVSRMEGLAVSAGAACHADNIEVSTVLEAMAIPVKYAMGTIRFSTGKYTNQNEIKEAIEIVSMNYGQLKNNIPSDNQVSGIRLTQYTHGLGCACKLDASKLDNILKKLPASIDPNILVGPTTSDDAAVYKINDELAIVQTLDFFTPIVDDPYDFGAIAAANAISDIYAMGAKPIYAQNIVGFPEHVLPLEVLEQILKGASEKAKEAGIEITGGHTIEDPEPKFGMVVTGTVHPSKIIRNYGAGSGDHIILTKPIGSGIMATALKRGLLSAKQIKELTENMLMLNQVAAEIMLNFRVKACTDVTGFGLLGHLKEMSVNSSCDLQLDYNAIPILNGVIELMSDGVIPGGSKQNLSFVSDVLEENELSEVQKLILADAQTSGGLLIAVDQQDANSLLEALNLKGVKDAAIIGKFEKDGKGLIRIY